MNKIKTIDSRRNLICPGDLNKTITYTADYICKLAIENIKQKGSFNFALSGGYSPMELFTEFTSAKYSSKINWKKAHLFFVDERAVSPDNGENNYHNIMNAGFNKIPIPTENIHRMVAEINIEENSKAYEKALLNTITDGALDFILLGLGPDGHTASLFPNTEALKETKRQVVANNVPQKNMWRMTMTYPFINKSRNILFYCVGESKAQMVKSILSQDLTPYPASRIGTSKIPALWVVDSSASKLL